MKVFYDHNKRWPDYGLLLEGDIDDARIDIHPPLTGHREPVRYTVP